MDNDLSTQSKVEQLCTRIRNAADENTMLRAMNELTKYLTKQREAGDLVEQSAVFAGLAIQRTPARQTV